MTPILSGNVDICDDAAIDRAVQQVVRPVLADPAFAADRLPPGARAWFGGFLHRCAAGSLLQSHPAAPVTKLDALWHDFTGDMAARGVVPTVLDILHFANDGDAGAEARGQVDRATAFLAAFLRDCQDLHDFTARIALTRDQREWARYPAWFGRPSSYDDDDRIAHCRAIATRWLQVIGRDGTVFYGLIDDDVAEVRFIATVRLAQFTIDDPHPTVIDRLREAAADKGWIWSHKDHSDDGSLGCHTARATLRAVLGRHGPQMPTDW